MRDHRTIPLTPIMDRYLGLRTAPQQRRLLEAEQLVDQPEILAREFADSVRLFSEYTNPEEHFYPPARPRHSQRSQLQRTIDVTLRLDGQSLLRPVDARGRSTTQDAGPTVIPVPAGALAAEYVDRELLVQRTTSPAAWSDGRANIGGLRLDLLLADAADRTPIVAELKLPGDMDPFFALVQALACAAHLATPSQYERMRRHLERGRFPLAEGQPRLDLWLLYVDRLARVPGAAPRGRYMPRLHAAAEALAPRILAREEVARSIRRMAGLGLTLEEDDSLRAEVRWAWSAASSGPAAA